MIKNIMHKDLINWLYKHNFEQFIQYPTTRADNVDFGLYFKSDSADLHQAITIYVFDAYINIVTLDTRNWDTDKKSRGDENIIDFCHSDDVNNVTSYINDKLIKLDLFNKGSIA